MAAVEFACKRAKDIFARASFGARSDAVYAHAPIGAFANRRVAISGRGARVPGIESEIWSLGINSSHAVPGEPVDAPTGLAIGNSVVRSMRADPTQLLDIDVNQLTETGALVAADRLRRIQTAEFAEADPLAEGPATEQALGRRVDLTNQ